jgi:DNA-binding LytR/AlgR family response regulator
MLMPVTLATCYFFNYILVPRFLLAGKYKRFVLYSLYMLLTSFYLAQIVIFLAFVFLAAYSYQNMAMVATDVVLLTMVQYLFVFSFSFVLLFRQLVQNRLEITQLKNKEEKHQLHTLKVRSNRKSIHLPLDQIKFIESLGDYVHIHRETKEPVITKSTISSIEMQLPSTFIRIHRSFLINSVRISSFDKEGIYLGEQYFSFGRTYKKSALEVLEKNAHSQ